jgi:hypothetical protein
MQRLNEGGSSGKNSSERSRQLHSIMIDSKLTHEWEFQHKTVDRKMPR